MEWPNLNHVLSAVERHIWTEPTNWRTNGRSSARSVLCQWRNAGSRRPLMRGTLGNARRSFLDYIFATLIWICEWRELPIVDSCLESPPLIALVICVEGLVDEASPILAHVLEFARPQSFLCICHGWIGFTESESPFAILELMSMFLHWIPAILNRGTGT